MMVVRRRGVVVQRGGSTHPGAAVESVDSDDVSVYSPFIADRRMPSVAEVVV